MPGIHACSDPDDLLPAAERRRAFNLIEPIVGTEVEKQEAAQPQRDARLEPRRLGLHFRFRLGVFAARTAEPQKTHGVYQLLLVLMRCTRCTF